MSHFSHTNWRRSLQIASSIPLFILTASSIQALTSTTPISEDERQSKSIDTASCISGSDSSACEARPRKTNNFKVNDSKLNRHASRSSLQKSYSLQHSSECKDEDVNLNWVKDSMSTRVICRQIGISDEHGERLINDLQNEDDGNGFDPADSIFYEIQMTPRAAISESSSSRNKNVKKDVDMKKNEVSESSRRPSKDDLNTKSKSGITSNKIHPTTHYSDRHYCNASSSLSLPLLNNTVIILPNLLSEDECQRLVRDAERILDETRHPGVKTEKWAQFFRFEKDSKAIMDRILRETVLEFISLRLPVVAKSLFRWNHHHHKSASPLLAALIEDDEEKINPVVVEVPKGKPMDFYWDDPVVIKYTAGNRIAPHQDMRELTIVVPLQTSLKGGGTRFWLEGTMPDDADVDQGVLINPPPGSGVIFNGDMTHSGSSVLKGTRFVLMTSINLDDCEGVL